MKASKAEIERALKAPGADTRLFLLHGPDEAGSRALAALLVGAMGPAAERVDLTGAELKSDPARLADEASSISLFGARRFIWVEPAGDEIVPAVEALIESNIAGNPVISVAGALKNSSKLLKLALAEPSAMTYASYVPEGREADKLVLDMGREQGLIMRPDVARRIAEASGGNRAIVGQELIKYALFTDAAPERPKDVDENVLQAIGAAAEEGDLGGLVDSVVGGNGPALRAELLRLSGRGIEGITLLRAVLRRMMLLASMRAEVERGNSPETVVASKGKALFWKERAPVSQQLGRWRPELLAKAVNRLLEADNQVKASGGVGPIAADEELFAICRQAAKLR